MEHFQSGQPVMRGRGRRRSAMPTHDGADAEIVEQIKELLDTRVRPAVAQDGGDITFHGFDRGVVYLHMQGACAGCPSSTLTLKMGIENLLRHYIPEVTEVRPVARSEPPLDPRPSTPRPRIARPLCVRGDRVLAARATSRWPRGQAERLLPMLEEMLAEAGVGWRDLDGIGVGTGPGNFTGIADRASRAARGLALGARRPGDRRHAPSRRWPRGSRRAACS